ncbi:hypothetical protein [Streptomyces liliifuscus]|uniref:AlpA family phage regulatory protein n=1 Tax=Streptomyces liliifuscus TaxID=2797636 RepID=A0A7T7RFT1_9ACTN|nr:hypothetical protein [Streptomyces liliifuscus]QQM45102.1 hypothetical protein JEQ17_40705 [Streptomyces liliifuscus]
MPRKAPHFKQSAPPGFVYINEASRLSGRSIETLYKDRSIQRRTGQCPGPPSETRNRKAVWLIAEIQAWHDAQGGLGPDPEQLHNSRPAEPARAAA